MNFITEGRQLILPFKGDLTSHWFNVVIDDADLGHVQLPTFVGIDKRVLYIEDDVEHTRTMGESLLNLRLPFFRTSINSTELKFPWCLSYRMLNLV
jgi:hypothetical protein